MLISYKWLQSYFEEKLPEPEKLAELITFGFAEVESIKSLVSSDFTDKRGYKTQINADGEGDTVFDIKVLPDRACYALSHRGVAYEVAALLDRRMTTPEFRRRLPKVAAEAVLPVARVEEDTVCKQLLVRRINGVSVKPSPAWLQEKLRAVGHRAINAVVDVTNFVMFDIGRPLHAFDAHTVRGPIVVRFARTGERMTTLDGKEISLDASVLILADNDGPLALAGIKGGARAAVTEETTDLILEAANWDAAYVRRTSQKLGLKTDAAKRFENRLPASLAQEGIEDATALIVSLSGAAQTAASPMCVIGDDHDAVPKLEVSVSFLAKRIGGALDKNAVLDVLRRLDIDAVEKKGVFSLTPPAHRLDLRIPEDIVEEVARIIGYDKIPAVLPEKSAKHVEIPESFHYEWKVREILVNSGFSEVMTSSFWATGDIAIEKPLAEDKKYARPNLRGSFKKALKMNALNAPLFGADETRIFEIGRVFPKSGEVTALAIGYVGPKKNGMGILVEARALLAKELGVPFEGEEKDSVFECNLDHAVQSLTLYTGCNLVEKWNISIPTAKAEKFKPFSVFPFIVRDIALFVSSKTTPESAAKVIREHMGKLVVRGPELFDEFSKEKKKSFAFRLIFQSFEKTLTDEEINGFMEKIYSAVRNKGWKIR